MLAAGAVGGHIRPMFERAQRGGDAASGTDRQQEVRLRSPEPAQAPGPPSMFDGLVAEAERAKLSMSDHSALPLDQLPDHL